MKVVRVVNLNDVFPDGLMGEGIFYALNTHNVPWKTSISSVALDLEYYGNVSGGKTIAPLLRRLLVDNVMPQSAITRLANSLYSMNALRWTKLWDTYQLEYNPIENYNMTEIMSDDDTVTTYGRTHSKTGTEVDDRTRTDDNKESVYGFNSSTASDSDESDRTINDDNTHTYNVSDTDTGSDRQSHSYELTRSGNIGVTTSQQMIESERSLWMWKYFYDVVFPDIDRMLTISVYSDDVIPITSGGVTPTGEIDITLNGVYDVTEYASAEVQVPNTYTAADEGMVVYNGELVSQIGREISANGTYDTTLNNALSVSVPNTYTDADEGKVVDNGSLVVQSSQNISHNGTYNTTLKNEVVVNVIGDALPNDYQEVTYLQNDASGSAYIYCPLPRIQTGDVLEYSAENDSWGSGYYIMTTVKTSYDQSTGARLGIGLYQNKRRLYGGTGTICDTDDPSKTAGESITYGDTITTGKFTQSITFVSWPLTPYAFYYGRYAASVSGGAYTKLYTATFARSDGSVYAKFVPCYRKSDSVCGFYEVHSKVFITASAGTFTAGPDVN